MFVNYLRLWFCACVTFPVRLLLALPAEGALPFLRRLLLFPLLAIAFLLLNLLHLIGFLCDELLFPGYRKVQVTTPLFITGIPRSGTTHLQRVLAQDEQFTTLRSWEVLFAPSITERHVYRFLGRLLSPLGRAAAGIRKKLFGAMDEVHVLGLLEAEEDFFLLLWIDHCFLAAFLCPDSAHYWRLGDFCSGFVKVKQDRVLRYYDQCLRKHLYFHGRHKRLLSKNPSFTSLIPALKRAWPDARFVFCVREPESVVASQLSSLRPAMRLLGRGKLSFPAQERLLGTLHGYYAALNAGYPDVSVVDMRDIQRDTVALTRKLYDWLQHPMHDDFFQRLQDLQQASRRYRTAHRYHLQDFGLDEAGIRARFADVWTGPETEAEQP